MAMCFSQNVTYNLSIITEWHTLWQSFLSSTIPYPISFSEGLFLFLFPPKVHLSIVTPLFFKHSGNMECYPVTEIFHIFSSTKHWLSTICDCLFSNSSLEPISKSSWIIRKYLNSLFFLMHRSKVILISLWIRLSKIFWVRHSLCRCDFFERVDW